MTIFKKINRSSLIISSIILSIFLLTKCISNNGAPEEKLGIKNADGKEFAGSLACAKCHQDIYSSHVHTAHYLTSRPAVEQYIKGSFELGNNSYAFSPYVSVVMEKRDSSFYQVKYVNGMPQIYERFDVVFGSGKNGQTYAYWSGNRLFQLPIFYFSARNEWANSPGYPGEVIFGRPITSRCFECHSTYVQKVSDAITEPEEYDHNQIIFGVDCERCHGPGEEHMEFQTQNSKETKAKYIINPANLSREQNLNLCALCHGGKMTKSKPSFSFQPGDTLSNYFLIDTAGINVADIDVHGNQYGLLAASKCFKMSEMTCTTCHNSHENETGKLELFSQRCMTCHNTDHKNFCKMEGVLGDAIKANCIDCHMPVQSSKAIVFLEQGSKIPVTASMRSHFIKIYPDETKKFLLSLK